VWPGLPGSGMGKIALYYKSMMCRPDASLPAFLPCSKISDLHFYN
jgi:hypothetical protein